MNLDLCWKCKYLMDIEYEKMPKTKHVIKNEDGIILGLCEVKSPEGPIVDITCSQHQKPSWCTKFKRLE